MIKVENLYYRYREGNEFALNGINLQIASGEFLAIIGPNGCGKSTFAKHLNGIILPSGGSVLIDNLNTGYPDNIWEIRKKVGMVFQNPDNQLVGNVVEEEVAFGPENICMPPKDIRLRVDNSLKSIGLYDLKKVSVNMLSGGQKQKVAIASILAMEPSYIAFDEPTTMLDPKSRHEVFNIIKKLNKDKKITIIYITHFMEEAVCASRVVVLNKGQVMLDGKPPDIFLDIQALRNLSLDAPPMIWLVHELNKAGMGLPEFIISPEEAAEEIIARISLKKGVKSA